MKVLILATNHKSLAVKLLTKELKLKSIHFNILNPNQLFLMISNHENGRNNLFDDHTAKTIRKVDLNDYDIIIPRIGTDVDYCCEVLKYLEEVFGMKTLQSSEAISNAYSKIRTAIHLRAAGIRTPKTFYINRIKNVDQVLTKLSKDEKYVIKLDKGSKGKQVSIVSGMPEAKSVLDTIGNINRQLIIQEFVDSKGTDIRAIVVGGNVVAAYQRSSGKNELRTNISTGGEGSKIVLTEEENKFCCECATAVGLDFAGIDIMKDADGKLFCIEVNHCPGMNVQKFTPISISKKVVELAIRKMEENETKSISLLEVESLKKIKKETYNDLEFNKLFIKLKGKVVESKLTGIQSIITSKYDLQKLLIKQINIL